MNRSWLASVVRRLAVGALCCSGWWLASDVVRADEPAAEKKVEGQATFELRIELPPPPADPPAPAGTAKPAGEIPVLSKIPYLNRLFKNVEGGGTPLACDEASRFERIGVDFDVIPPAHVVGAGQNYTLVYGPTAAKGTGVCKTCPNCPSAVVGVPQVLAFDLAAPTGPAACDAKTPQVFGFSFGIPAEAACVPNCPEGTCLGVAANRGASKKTCCAGAECGTVRVCQALADSSGPDREELLEALFEASIEKTRLEGRLESLQERDQLREELVELVLKNAALEAKLKHQEELHALQLQGLKQMIELGQANEQLKKRVAELEAARARSGEPAASAYDGRLR